MAILSYNQIIKGLSDIATAHQQIASFGEGDFGNFATSGVTNYPIMWCDLTSAQRVPNLTQYNIDIYVADLVRNGNTNEREVMSDMHRIAEDIIAEIRHPSWTWNVIKDTAITINNYVERTDDIATGVVFSVAFRIIRPDNTCELPEETITRF